MSDTSQMECPFCAESINSKAKKCKHCGEFLDVALRAAEEARKNNAQNVFMNAVTPVVPPVLPVEEKRSMTFLLGLGIVFMPYIFSWFTLRKGHTVGDRVVAFVWLIASFLVFAEAKN